METEVQVSKTLEQLKRSRAASMGVIKKNAPKIQEMRTKVQAGTFSDVDLDTANILLETSESRRNLIKDLNEKIIDKTEDSDEAMAKEMEDSHEMFFRVHSQVKELQRLVAPFNQPDRTASPINEPQYSRQATSGIKIPKFVLPKFGWEVQRQNPIS